MLNNDHFTLIAKKYSSTDINTNEDVEKFFETMGENFSTEKIEEIITELTEALYSGPPPGFFETRKYPEKTGFPKINEYPQDDEGVVCGGRLPIERQSFLKRFWAAILALVKR